jgi:hypothetical protein
MASNYRNKNLDFNIIFKFSLNILPFTVIYIRNINLILKAKTLILNTKFNFELKLYYDFQIFTFNIYFKSWPENSVLKISLKIS